MRSDVPPSIAGNVAFLTQGLDLLEALTDALYTGSHRGWAPVGAQYRHVLEHYHSFLDGLADGDVNYDARARDPRLETSRDAARDATAAARDALVRLDDLDRPLRVHMDAGGEGPDWRPSSVGRELQFLSSHTVHHFALIRLLLQGLGYETGEAFGIAPSTLAHERAGR